MKPKQVRSYTLVAALTLGLSSISTSALSVPDEVRYDMLMNRLVEQVEDKQHLSSLKTISELKQLKSNLPSYLLYFEGKALYESGQKAAAYDVLLKYVTKYGKKADYYDKAISYLSKSESAHKAKLAEKAAAKKREQERKQAIIAKRLAEVEKAKAKERQKVLDYIDAKRRAKGFKERYLEHYTDNMTGLQWTMPIANRYGYNKTISSVDKKNFGDFDAAKRYCAGLILDGHTDWQLPTAVQLDFMSNALLAKMHEKDEYRYRIWFIGDKRFNYRYEKKQRTNTLYKAKLHKPGANPYEPPSRNKHYDVITNTNVKTASMSCVRVTDSEKFKQVQSHQYDLFVALSPRQTTYMISNSYFLPTGINFRAKDNYDDDISIRAAKNRCEDMELAGHNDWRLPTKEETIQLHRNKFSSRKHLTYPDGDEMCFYGSQDSYGTDEEDDMFGGGGLSDEIGIAQNIGGSYSDGTNYKDNKPIIYTSAKERDRISMSTEACNYYCIRKVAD